MAPQLPLGTSIPDRTDREFILALLAAEEAEKEWVARELHNHFGQNLAACRLVLPELLKGADPARRALVDKLDLLTTQLAKDLHRIGAALRPTALADLGLLATLEGYLADWSASTGVTTSSHLAALKLRLPAMTETLLFRIAQEALRNVERHAKARSVSIVAECDGRMMTLIFEDDGCGFDVEYTTQRQSDGRGMMRMMHRAALLGGTMAVESTPGRGTTVYVRVPFDPGTAR